MFLEKRQPVTHAVAAGAFVLLSPLSSPRPPTLFSSSSPYSLLRPSRPRHGCVRCSRRKADSNTPARVDPRDISQAERVRESSRMATSNPTF